MSFNAMKALMLVVKVETPHAMEELMCEFETACMKAADVEARMLSHIEVLNDKIANAIDVLEDNRSIALQAMLNPATDSTVIRDVRNGIIDALNILGGEESEYQDDSERDESESNESD
jgi:hypothetical protein